MSENHSTPAPLDTPPLYTLEGEDQNREKSSELIKNTRIPKSPFDLISAEDRHFIALGRYRISDVYGTEEEALKALVDDYWNIQLNLMTLVSRLADEDKELLDQEGVG